MKYYILVIDGKARENIPEWSPDLPNVPIGERYAPGFLARCMLSDTEIPEGWLHNANTGEFTEPPAPEPIPEPELWLEPEPGVPDYTAFIAGLYESVSGAETLTDYEKGVVAGSALSEASKNVDTLINNKF